MSSETFHIAFGAYGIITKSDSLLVIDKNGGPYINRFDLPGGSLDEGEPLGNTVIREIKEETGLTVLKSQQLGTVSFRYPWKYQRYTWNEHICVFYDIQRYSGQAASMVVQFSGQDSLGAKWIKFTDLNIDNSSPLVLKARDYAIKQNFKIKDETYETWKVLTKP